MANLLDYIDWRGDLTFRQSAFNEADNLALSMAAFVELSGVVPSEPWGMPVKLSVCAEKYREKYPEGRYYGLTAPANLDDIFYRIATSPRFRDLYATAFVSDLDEAAGKQFGAATLVLPDNSLFLSFRGTDDAIVGWREDFALSYACPVPSQKAAAEYLESVAAFHRGDIRLGGHSKGGNLAVYAAVSCKPEIQSRILRVYNNDGPGFTPEFLASDAFRAMESRIVTYVPQSSVVGMLLSHNEDYQVIESSGQGGILQHDPLSWEVRGTSFVHLDGLSAEGRKSRDRFRRLLDGMDVDRRRRFTEIVFEIVEATEAKTLTELSEARLKNALIMIRAYNELEREEKEELRSFIRRLVNISSELKR